MRRPATGIQRDTQKKQNVFLHGMTQEGGKDTKIPVNGSGRKENAKGITRVGGCVHATVKCTTQQRMSNAFTDVNVDADVCMMMQ